jgi:hypothetical protein
MQRTAARPYGSAHAFMKRLLIRAIADFVSRLGIWNQNEATAY